jgi:hypothetical protein
MLLLHRVVLPAFAVVGLAFLIACGGSGASNSTPPPSGGFSNSDFNGTYTFSIAGNDNSVPVVSSFGSSSSLGAYSAAGTITASSGKITAGTVDLFDVGGTANNGVAAAAVAVDASASNYNVNANGIGTLTLNLGGGAPPLDLTFVLTDAAHGLIMENDQNFTGSGTIDLQPSSVTLSNSSYAFSLSGGNIPGTGTTGQPAIAYPLAAVGAFTLDSSGAITAGLADINDGGTPAAAQSLTGNVTTGSGTNPGTATLTFSGVGTLTFDVYAIDDTHLKLIEKDGNSVVLVGDLFSQPSATIPAATLSFTMASLNIAALSNGSSSPSVLAVGGTVLSDGTSTLSKGAEYVDSNGTLNTSAAPFTGGFSLSPSGNTNGRYAVNLTSFSGGANFAAYPSSGGVLMLEVDTGSGLGSGGGITAGVAMAQNSPAGVVASQGYALNLTGADLINGTEVDQIAQFNTTSGKLSGAIYQSDFNVGFNNYSFGGASSFTTGATGQVALHFNGIISDALYFGVDSATSLVLAGSNQNGNTGGYVSLGIVQQQGSPSSKTDIAARHLAMIKAVAFARARAAREKKQ